MLEGDLVARCSAHADRVLPDVVAGLLLAEFNRPFAVDSVRPFVVNSRLPAIPYSGILQRIERLWLPFREDNHKLVAVCVRVRAHERRVLLLIDHDVVHVPADAAPNKRVLEAGETAASFGDFFADNPNADTAGNGCTQNCA